MMTFYEFFAGGGMARAGLGLEWRCTFANDIDRAKGQAYATNWGSEHLKVRDVAGLTTADLPGRVALAWASPPCQDFSLAGFRTGLEGARSGAFWPFWRLMLRLRTERRAPRLIVIENVAGLLTSHGGQDFDTICSALTWDYRFGALMIDAELFVPQSRQRVFIVAVDPDVGIPTELLASEPSPPFHPPALVTACQRQINPLWWRLPIPPKRNTTFADLVEDEPAGVRWHTQAETDRLLGMMTPLHLAKVEAAKRAGKRMVGGLYRRIRPDGAGGKVQRAEVRFDDVAGCLRVPTGGSSRQTIVIVEGDTVRSRLLSPREASRLMGLPDEYRLPGNYNEAYGLLGDGVCVPAVRHLAEYVLEPILQRPRSHYPIAAQ